MNAPEDPPTRIGNRYRLEERIGTGAMGVVWLGTDELLNRPVALKELLTAAVLAGTSGADSVEESRQRLMREGRIGARLQHPHVISMFDVVIHEERPWLVMEYLPSQSLAAVLSTKGSMEPRDAAEMGRQVADGLAAAHMAGVVHRDVKPGNVLIAEDGRVKLTDFGVSRAVDDVQLTRTGMIAGTPAFLAPEIARGREPAAPSDVFALGATLYAAVEGVPPFGLDDNAYALLHRVATGEVDPPQQAGPLEPLLMWLLAVEPGDRPTAAQARDALALVAAGQDAPVPAGAVAAAAPRPSVGRRPATTRRPTSAASPAPAGPGTVAVAPATGGRPRRRGPLLLVAALLALLVGAGITAAVLAGNSGDPSPPAAAPTTSPSATAQPTTEPDAPSSPPESTTSSPPPTTTPAPSTDAAAPATDPVAFVQGYYSLLPDDTDAAWAQLSPNARAQSTSREVFEQFYSEFESVTLQNARATGDDTVEATVVFDRINGATTNEPYRFVVGEVNGAPVLESFERI